jgi:hypothetical protein
MLLVPFNGSLAMVASALGAWFTFVSWRGYRIMVRLFAWGCFTPLAHLYSLFLVANAGTLYRVTRYPEASSAAGAVCPVVLSGRSVTTCRVT